METSETLQISELLYLVKEAESAPWFEPEKGVLVLI